MSKAGQNGTDYIIGAHRYSAPALRPALYLVSTPIGNLGDITIRALETLAAADIVACEDTRTTRILLDRYGINRRLVSCHEHNEAQIAAKLMAEILDGKSIALASDAGTPLVSDPGFRMVQAATEAGVDVVPVPGPSAVVTALQMSGLPSDAFSFAGFLPAKSGQRKTKLSEWKTNPSTVLFFESPRRLAASLADMSEVLGPGRSGAVCREMTKKFEEVRRGSLSELATFYTENGAPRGEIVIAVAPGDNMPVADQDSIDTLLFELASNLPASRAAAEASRQTGVSKQDLYKRLLELKKSDG